MKLGKLTFPTGHIQIEPYWNVNRIENLEKKVRRNYLNNIILVSIMSDITLSIID